MVTKALATLPARATAITAANRHHAVTSLLAALAMASIPIGVFPRFRSCTIRAKTGKAVILIEMAINSANGINAACPAPNSG